MILLYTVLAPAFLLERWCETTEYTHFTCTTTNKFSFVSIIIASWSIYPRNEDTLSRSASHDMPIDSTQEVPALSFGNPTYQTGEDAEETEARYASVSDAQYAAVSEAQYTSVSEPPPLYEDVTVKKIVSEEPNYQVVSELQVQSREVEHSENKQDLAEMEKEDLGPVVSPSREEEDTKK